MGKLFKLFCCLFIFMLGVQQVSVAHGTQLCKYTLNQTLEKANEQSIYSVIFSKTNTDKQIVQDELVEQDQDSKYIDEENDEDEVNVYKSKIESKQHSFAVYTSIPDSHFYTSTHYPQFLKNQTQYNMLSEKLYIVFQIIRL